MEHLICDPHLERCQYAEDAVNNAVKKVFAILGVDVDKPESVEKFREDLRFGGKLRRAADHGFMTMIGTLAAAVLAAIWLGFMARIKDLVP